MTKICDGNHGVHGVFFLTTAVTDTSNIFAHFLTIY